MNDTNRALALVVVAVVSAGCGGGGGGVAKDGAFTLGGDSATFSAYARDAVPAPVSIPMTVTGRDAVYVGAGYPPEQGALSWLSVDIVGTSSLQVALSVTTTYLTPGTYTGRVLVGTADQDGNILATRELSVSYTVAEHLAITSAALSISHTYGDEAVTAPADVTVRAPADRRWSATSDAAWLQVDPAVRSGDGTCPAAVDVQALAPGRYVGHVTVANAADATRDRASATVTVDVKAPALAVDVTPIVLGGADGLSAAPAAVAVKLTGGTTAQPLSVEPVTDSGGAWLVATPSAGTVGAGGVTVTIDALRAGLGSGTFTGHVRVVAKVKELELADVVPVTLHVEARRLVVTAAGVGLTAAPTRSVLSRDVEVLGTAGLPAVQWEAASDQTWLSVTPSGLTGGELTLAADPAGLAAGTTHFATVTVTSPDPSVENRQTIRVGLHVTSADPAKVSVAQAASFVAASPVEPVVFVNSAGSSITAYDVNTGAVVRTFSSVVGTAGPMAVSPDGRTLFVYDRTNLRVTELDAVSGALVRNYVSSALGSDVPYGGGLAVLRPGGAPVLVTPSSRMYDPTTGAELPARFNGAVWSYSLVGSTDGAWAVTDFGSVYRVVRTALRGGSVTATSAFGVGAAGRAGQACISADRTTVYVASGGRYEFPGYDMGTRATTQVLPGDAYPNAVVCAWNGVVVGGIDGYYDAVDVFPYYGPTGASLGGLSSSPATSYRSLVHRGLAVSADGARLVSLTAAAANGSNAAQILFQRLPSP